MKNFFVDNELVKKYNPPSESNIYDTPYYYFNDFFTEDEIEWIEILEKKLQFDSAKVTNKGVIDKQNRICDAGWIPYTEENSWIFDKIWSSVNKTNGWNLDIEGFSDNIQYTIYDASKHENPPHYTWHSDIGEGLNHRKISLSILLTEGFEGGEFELGRVGVIKEIKNKGDAIMFPSHVEHRVLPVTKGIRKSLVVWISGPKIR